MRQTGIENKSYFVKIGCTEEERSKPQEIIVTIIINLAKHQKGCLTDNVKDVYSHGKINDIITSFCDSKNEYNLIEFLAMKIKNTLISTFNINQEDEKNEILVKIYKKSRNSFCVV